VCAGSYALALHPPAVNPFEGRLFLPLSGGTRMVSTLRVPIPAVEIPRRGAAFSPSPPHRPLFGDAVRPQSLWENLACQQPLAGPPRGQLDSSCWRHGGHLLGLRAPLPADHPPHTRCGKGTPGLSLCQPLCDFFSVGSSSAVIGLECRAAACPLKSGAPDRICFPPHLAAGALRAGDGSAHKP